MQLHQSEFRNVWACARYVYRVEGLSAFYISYPTTLAITIPFNAIQFTVYEHIKRFSNPRNDYSPATHVVAGGIAGAVAAAVTTPLDVAKTILQTRGTAKDADIRNVSGMMDALRVIWTKDGVKGFGRGLTARVLTAVPSTALCWLSYEFFSSCPFLICLVLVLNQFAPQRLLYELTRHNTCYRSTTVTVIIMLYQLSVQAPTAFNDRNHWNVLYYWALI